MKYPILLICLLLSYNFWGKAQIPPIPFPKNIEHMTTVDSGFIIFWYAFNPLKVSYPKTYDDFQIGQNMYILNILSIFHRIH